MKFILLALFLITSTAHGAVTKVPGALISQTIVTKTSTYTASNVDDVILVDATSGAFTVSLPTAASSVGKKYVFKKIDNGTNLVTIDPSGSETIDLDTTVPLGGYHSTLEIVSTGSYWMMIQAPSVSTYWYQTYGQSVTNAVTTERANFDVKYWDSHNAVVTGVSTWAFTVPISGTYIVSSQICWTANATGTREMYINNSSLGVMSTTNTVAVISAAMSTQMAATTQIRAIKGSTITITMYQNSGGALAFVTGNSSRNYVAITRVGGY